ncbi:MAG: FemAB family PEP-CTERM system-associated protein [Candidatus Electrothrix sp. ATG2]|nr:FemAB family PEP-CTERM system-associated protein [Candidatus Electrothrix sp. ATG2]
MEDLTTTIEITAATDKDQPEWDLFVHSCSNASPYHLFAWGKTITQAYHHKKVYLLARQGGEVVGVLPMVHLQFPFLLNELVALPFCDVGGSLAVNSDVEGQLIAEAKKWGERLNVTKIQVRGPIYNKLETDANFTPMMNNKVRMLLSLPDSSEKLMAGFKSKLRSQIRKSEKNGVVFRWAGEEGVGAFYSVFCDNMRMLGSPVHSRRLFHAVMDNYGENAYVGLTEFEGRCIGAGLILSTDQQTAIPWASTLRQYNKLAPNMLLYWNFLKYAADNNKKIFDFGRSTENEGTFRFKKQWGAQPVPLSWYATVKNNQKMSGQKKSEGAVREKVTDIWRKIPLPVANFLGPQLRKYINL